MLAFVVAASLNWPVFGHDPARSGVNDDRAISASNVRHLRQRWTTKLGGVADSAPIYVAGVHGRDMLFQTARDGTTYGIDARSGRILWRFRTSGPNITTSVPAADPSRDRVYAPGVDGMVHQLALSTGAEIRYGRFPIRITQMPQTEKDAASLNLANGYLYVATSGYFGDATPYVGHVVAVRLSDGAMRVFNTLCSTDRNLPSPNSCAQNLSGIWARAGVVVDPDPSMHGRIYFASGNGDFNAASGGHNYGDSVVALSADATNVLGYYTPPMYAELGQGDTDLGSTAPALLPRESRSKTPLMMVQGGKDAILRLLNRERLPGVGGELQRIDLGTGLFSAPAVWRDPHGRTWLYLGLPDGVRAFRVATGSTGKTRLEEAWRAHAGQTNEGTSPIVDNGVVFVAMDDDIIALDAQSGVKLWSSAGSGHSIGNVHWESPIAAGGWLYCSDENGDLTAYDVPAAADPPASRPLTILQGRADGLVPAVRGTVNGRSIWFDLDTGALESFIDASVARALHLASVGSAAVAGAGTGKAHGTRLAPVTVRLRAVNFIARNPIALDLSGTGSTLRASILGFDFYRRYVVAIDFGSYRVALYDPRSYRYAGNGVAIPLVIRPPRAFVRVTVLAKGVPAEQHTLRLDVGSNDAVDDDVVLRSSAPKRTITGGVGIGNRFSTYLGTVDTLRIGPFTLHDLPSATGGVQLIGDAVWHRFNVVFDFSRSVMYLTPRR